MMGYRELWIRWLQVLLVLAGLVLLARPASHRVRLVLNTWRAERAWQEARNEPNAHIRSGEPAAFVRLKSIGLPADRCEQLSQAICNHLDAELEIPPDLRGRRR